MDIKSLYELAGKPLPDTEAKVKEGEVGTCSHLKTAGGNSVEDDNLLNIKGNNELFPHVPLVPAVLTNPVKITRARVGGGEVNLCAEIRSKGISLLSKAANEINHPLNDLIEWYGVDLDIISESTLDEVRVSVKDYVARREEYRAW